MQETTLQSNNTPLMLSTQSYNSSQMAAYNSNYRYTQQATFKEGQDDHKQGATKDEDTNTCEHDYHVLEQPIGTDNDYEELDKYEKKERSQQEGSALKVEGEGPEDGVCTGTNDSTSEEHDRSVLISKYGN